MRNPRKRWVLTLKIAAVGASLLPLIAAGLEWWSRASQTDGFAAEVVILPGDYAVIGWTALVGLSLGLMIGLVVNAIMLIAEEPRPHW